MNDAREAWKHDFGGAAAGAGPIGQGYLEKAINRSCLGKALGTACRFTLPGIDVELRIVWYSSNAAAEARSDIPSAHPDPHLAPS